VGAAFWFWLLLGIALLGAEWKLGTLFILWFGVAAEFVALMLWLYPGAGWDAQLFLWGVTGCTLVWSRFGSSR